MKRRDFLKTAGLCAASLTVLPSLASLGHAAAPGFFTWPGNSLAAKRWAMVIDTRKLTSPALLQKNRHRLSRLAQRARIHRPAGSEMDMDRHI